MTLRLCEGVSFDSFHEKNEDMQYRTCRKIMRPAAHRIVPESRCNGRALDLDTKKTIWA
jgi:hypothetical protein